jgi:hypothetical protein
LSAQKLLASVLQASPSPRRSSRWRGAGAARIWGALSDSDSSDGLPTSSPSTPTCRASAAWQSSLPSAVHSAAKSSLQNHVPMLPSEGAAKGRERALRSPPPVHLLPPPPPPAVLAADTRRNGDLCERRGGVEGVEAARAKANTHEPPHGQLYHEHPHQGQDTVGPTVSRDSEGRGRGTPSASLSPSRTSGAGVGESEYARLLMAAAQRADADAAAQRSSSTPALSMQV